jgi:glycosyltransferase involved in cell wall biosynthesis
MNGISLVIPAYNEEDRIAATLERFSYSLSKVGKPWEIIVVMDGIRDGTEKVVDSFASRGVRKLVFQRKLGKGGAVLKGLADAKYHWIGYVDADGAVSSEDTVKMFQHLEKYECVIASRWVKGSEILRSEPVLNTIAGRFYNFLVRSSLLLRVRDTQCGAKFFRGDIGQNILPAIQVTNRAFELSLLYHISKKGGKILEFPVQWSHDSRSRMPIRGAIPAMFFTLVAVRIMNSPLQRLAPNRIIIFFANKWRSV